MIHYRKMKIWLFEKNRLKKREVTRVIDRNSFLNKFIIIRTSQSQTEGWSMTGSPPMGWILFYFAPNLSEINC